MSTCVLEVGQQTEPQGTLLSNKQDGVRLEEVSSAAPHNTPHPTEE